MVGNDHFFMTASKRIVIILPAVDKKMRSSFRFRYFSKKKIKPPKIQAVAYISFWKITGISLHNISLSTPPKQAEMVPREIQINGSRSAATPFSNPTSVNNPNPIVSKRKIDVRRILNRFLKIIARTVLTKTI